MSEESLRRKRARRRASGVLAALAIGVTGVAWSGCGDDDNESGEAQDQIERGVEEGRQGIEKGREEAEKGIEKGKEEVKQGLDKAEKEAQDKIEEGRKQAEEGLEEAEKYIP